MPASAVKRIQRPSKTKALITLLYGVLDRVLEHLQRELGVHLDASVLGLDSTSVKVHPDGAGARKKTVRRP